MGEGFLFADQPALSCPPILYAIVAALVSTWQAYRGFRLQWLVRERKDDFFFAVARWEKVLLLCLSDGFFYGVCSLVGFASLWLAWSLIETAVGSGVSIGFGAIWIFLLLIGLTGVTGQLPSLIQLGKIVPGRS